jgi:hypothetical protein
VDVYSTLRFQATRIRNLLPAVATDEPLRKGEATGGSGSGDVVGPSSAVDGHPALFDGATGKLIKDSGLTLSGANTGDETAGTLGATVHGATAATGLISSDELPFVDTTSTPVVKRITWTNFKASIKAYLDSFYAVIGAITGSGLTMASGKLLGRGSAGTGAVEEITVGTGLSLSAGTLSATSSGAGKHVKGATWTGGGSVVATPADDVTVECHAAGIITKAVVLTQGGAGSCVIDVWKDSYANFPPTVADSITASAKPTIVTGLKYSDAALTGWTTAVAAGDTLTFHLDSVCSFTSISIFLEITP